MQIGFLRRTEFPWECATGYSSSAALRHLAYHTTTMFMYYTYGETYRFVPRY